MSLIATYAPHAMALVGAGGVGAAAKPCFDFALRRRKQSDDMAISVVTQLREEMAAMEARNAQRIAALETAAAQERQLCDAKLDASNQKMSVLRHQLRNVEGSFDGLLLALKHAPEKASQIVADVMAHRAAKLTARAG